MNNRLIAKKQFTVIDLENTLSGSYAIHLHENGVTKCHVKNYGYQIGDKVVIMSSVDYAPDLITVNGKIIWTEIDRDNYLANSEKEYSEMMELLCKSKGLKHAIYNP